MTDAEIRRAGGQLRTWAVGEVFTPVKVRIAKDPGTGGGLVIDNSYATADSDTVTFYVKVRGAAC